MVGIRKLAGLSTGQNQPESLDNFTQHTPELELA